MLFSEITLAQRCVLVKDISEGLTEIEQERQTVKERERWTKREGLTEEKRDGQNESETETDIEF